MLHTINTYKNTEKKWAKNLVNSNDCVNTHLPSLSIYKYSCVRGIYKKNLERANIGYFNLYPPSLRRGQFCLCLCHHHSYSLPHRGETCTSTFPILHQNLLQKSIRYQCLPSNLYSSLIVFWEDRDLIRNYLKKGKKLKNLKKNRNHRNEWNLLIF